MQKNIYTSKYSFFKDFKKLPIEIAFELFKCFVDNKFNV